MSQHLGVIDCGVNKTLVFLLSAIGGFSDVFGFIALAHLFTAHITGNIVIIIAYLVTDTSGVASKVVAIPVFMVFAAIISCIIELHGVKRKHLVFWLALEGMLFFFLMLLGSLSPKLNVTSLNFILLSMLPVCAMAIHNTISKLYLQKSPPVTMMTGNFTQFIIDLSAVLLYLFNRKSIISKKNAVKNILVFGSALLGFSLGGILAVTGYVFMHFWGVIFVMILIFLTMALLSKIK